MYLSSSNRIISNNFFGIALIVGVLLQSVIECAGPLIHTYLSQQWIMITEKYDRKESERFISGTLFPDIRYPAGIDKQKTHEADVTIATILQEPNAFKAGMQFHAWVDKFRIDNFEPQGLALVGKDPGMHFRTFLKLVEDDIIFDSIDRQYLISVLREISQEEHLIAHSLGISPDILAAWHQHLIYHIQTRPCAIITMLARQQKDYLINIQPEIVQRWHVYLPSYPTNKKMKKYVADMIDSFKENIKEQCFQFNYLN